jgi:hypothetical protein
MPNIVLNPPPNQQDIVDSKKALFSWTQWFDRLHYLLSPRNHQTITAASAINLDARYVAIQESAGNYAVTLAAPTVAGITKIIEMTARASGTVTLSLSNVVGGSAGTTASFDAVGETLILISRSAKWVVLKEVGVTLS